MSKNNSPLRYPGGKAKILDFMKEVVKSNFSDNVKPCYVELYAGGGAVALGLLIEGYVSDIYINDADPSIYCFWYNIVNNTNKFISKIKRTEVTIEEWKKQTKIYKANLHESEKQKFDLGFAAFYLNRCNHSGILKGGVIGGKSQVGKYKIDCRFNKNELIKKIKKIAEFKDKIHISSIDTLKLLTDRSMLKLLRGNCLLYLDPPYFKKGPQLYQNWYKPKDHKNISEAIKKLKCRWVLSYDNVQEIRALYGWVDDKAKQEFDLQYCLRATGKRGKEILFFSDKIRNIPDANLIG